MKHQSFFFKSSAFQNGNFPVYQLLGYNTILMKTSLQDTHFANTKLKWIHSADASSMWDSDYQYKY